MKLLIFAAAARHSLTVKSVMGPTAHRALAFLLMALLILPSVGITASATAPPSDPIPQNDYFLLYQDENGDVACREANAHEIGDLQRIAPKNLRQINHTEDKATGLAAAADQATVGDNAVDHLTIILLATPALDANAPAKAAFIRAAAAWENLITSPVTIYLEVDYGPTNFGTAWPSGVLGSTSSPSLGSVNYSVVRQNLINGANTPAKLSVYNALPASSVPTDLGNATSVSVSSSIARAIGLLNPVAQQTDNKARIGFNSEIVTYDFDHTNGISGTDFESVATHEIGHALGFTSRSGSGSSTPAMWDLYRFRSGMTTATFTSAQRIMTVGGPTANSQYYFVPGQSQLGLSDGGPSGSKDDNADGNQSSHWRHFPLNGGVVIGIMDPRIPGGVRRQITAADINALNIFGFNSNPVSSAPAPPNNNFAAAQALPGCSGTVNGTTVGATRESGEPNHFPPNGGGTHSVWYQWQAPVTTSVEFNTAGSPVDTVLAVYTGSAVGSLTVAASQSDDVSGTDRTSKVTFTASAGVTYRIAVDVFDNGSFGGSPGGDVGPITLNWSATTCNPVVPMQLLLDQSGPAADQAVALDSILMVRDPFLVLNSANTLNSGSDRNTRLVIYVADLQLPAGAAASAVTINLVDSNNQTHNVLAQDHRAMVNQPLTQITFRLPDNLPAGTCRIKVMTQNQVSNTATFRIRTN
ncbi:MAG: NF038122 family metalloprotease [Acidobacteria bacterium]|nr:NF038122 family metalloprotease [Acidobacteriota bacterium]